LREIQKEREGEEEDISRYWISTKREDTEMLNTGNTIPWRTRFG
jgi:hypothetical protein